MANRGQIVDTRGAQRPDILFEGEAGGLRLYVRADGISIVRVAPATDAAATDAGAVSEATGRRMFRGISEHSASFDPAAAFGGSVPRQGFVSRFDAPFPVCIAMPAMQGTGLRPEYCSYYLSRSSDAVTHVPVYDGIVCIAHSGGGELRFASTDAGIRITSSFPVEWLLDLTTLAAMRAAGIACSMDAGGGLLLGVGDGLQPASTSAACSNWMTYYGGTGGDWPSGLRHRNGYLYIAGATTSRDFPVSAGAWQTVFGGITDISLVKFDVYGNRIWSTYYGSSGPDGHSWVERMGIELDGNDDIVIAGLTDATDFPVTAGAFQSQNAGGMDAFACKFDQQGQRVWATYFGGSRNESFNGVAIDAANNIYLCGGTQSGDFPVTAGTLQSTLRGYTDGVIVKLSPNGARLWSTFLGGSKEDGAMSLTADADGNVVVVGFTYGTDFPVAGAPFQSASGGLSDMFATKLNPNGLPLWSTYIGGQNGEFAYAVTANANREYAICGYTNSTNFPVTPGCAQPNFTGQTDAAVLKLSSNGGLIWSTYFGGPSQDRALADAFDDAGNVVVGGRAGPDLPIPPAGFWAGKSVGFVTVFSPQGSILWGAYLGGCGPVDYVTGVAGLPGGDVCATGWVVREITTSPNAFQRVYLGNADGFIARVHPLPPPCVDAGPAATVCPGDSVRLQGSQRYGLQPLSYSWSPPDLLDDPSSLTPLARPLVSTVYSLTVTDGNGCPTEDTVLITISPAIVPEAGEDVVICPGDSVRLDGSASVGPGPYTWSWSPSASLNSGTEQRPMARPDSTTTYVLTVKGAFGCTARDSVTVTLRRPPMPVAGRDTAVCRGASVHLSVSASGGSPPYSFFWSGWTDIDDPGAAVTFAHPVASTMYVVTVTDSIGCRGRDTLHVTVYIPPAAEAGGDRVLCKDSSTVLGYPSTGGGTPPLVYAWTPSTGLSATNVAMPVARPDSTTCYHLLVTDARGCRAEDSVLVTVAPRMSVRASGEASGCEGTIVQLQSAVTRGQAPFTFAWSPANAVAQPSEQNTSAVLAGTTLFRVRATDANGCSGEDSILVRVLPAPRPRVTVSGPPEFCEGDSVTLTADAGFVQYRWTLPGGATRTGRSIVAKQSGIYRVTVTDSSGCEGSDSLRVTARPAFVLAATRGPIRLCEGDSAVLVANAGYRDYEWLNGNGIVLASSASIVVHASGRYVARARDSLGCFGYSPGTEMIVAPLPAPAIAGPRSACVGSRAAYTAAALAGRRYAWRATNGVVDSGDGTRRVVLRWGAAGTGTLELTETLDSSGCSATTLVDVTIGTSLAPAISGPSAFCAGDTAWLEADADYASIVWNDAGGDAIGTGRRLAVTASGSYTLFVSDGNGCTGTSSPHAVLMHAIPSVAVTGPSSLCLGDTIVLDAGGWFAAYAWRDSLGLLVGSDRRLVLWTGGTFTVEVLDSNGCRAAATHRLVAHTKPTTAIAGADRICEGDTTELEADAGFVSYEWRDSTGTIRGTDRRLAVSTGGAFTVDVQDRNGCRATATHRLVADPKPMPVIAGAREICAGDTAWLDAEAGYLAYTWSRPDGTRDSGRVVAATANGTYTVTVTAASGCTGSAAHALAVHPVPAPSIDGPRDICQGDTAVLATDPGYARYEWRRGTQVLPTSVPVCLVTEGGTYTVLVTDPIGCSGTSPAHTLAVHPLPAKPVIVPRGDTLIAMLASPPSGPYRCDWLRNDTLVAAGDTLFSARSGIYTVRFTDEYGCTSVSDPFEVKSVARIAAVVALPVIEAAPGQRISIPLSLVSHSGLAQSAAASIAASISFNRELLYPIEGTPMGTVDGGLRRITLTQPFSPSELPQAPSSPFPLTELRFLAMLGPVSSTPLTIDSLAFGGIAADIRMIAGEFRLLVCREGGERLFDAEGRIFLGQNRPNPFNAETEIEYETIESGRVRLSVFDLLGRRLALLVDDVVLPGRYRVHFDASSLASGMYFYILEIPSGRLVRTMAVEK